MESILDFFRKVLLEAFLDSPVTFCIAGIFILYFGWKGVTRARRLKKTAKAIAESAKSFEGGVEIAEVDLARDFPKLDQEFYNRQSNVVELLGFECVGDVEFLNLSRKQPWRRTCIRLLAPAHGEICAAICHMRASGWRRLFAKLGGTTDHRVTEFETELDNGFFVLTSNSEEVGKMSQPDEINMHIEPSNMAAAQLLNAHIGHVKTHLEKFPGTRPVPARTVVELVAMQARFHATRFAHRDSHGGPSCGESKDLIGDAVNDDSKAPLMEEVEKVQGEPAEVPLRQSADSPVLAKS